MTGAGSLQGDSGGKRMKGKKPKMKPPRPVRGGSGTMTMEPGMKPLGKKSKKQRK